MNVLTPSLHCLTISSLEAWKAVSSSADQENGTLDESRCRKGSMVGQVEKLYDICATAPYQDRTSVMFLGVGKLRMLSMKSEGGFTPVMVTLNPK